MPAKPRKTASPSGRKAGTADAAPAETVKPPFTLTLTPTILALVAEISEALGRLQGQGEIPSPRLRRDNRIRSIQASLAIEGNTLSLDQVTAILDGQRVLGSQREIQEVKNAIAAYESLTDWQPTRLEDLLAAHGQLMYGLVDRPGEWRRGGVGIQKGWEIIHMAPPAELVPGLLRDLLAWLASSPVHPLVASCVFHYEFEFIHPFSDGNGRMGRLWQTLILSRWKGVLAYLPLESVIRERQEDYYAALRHCDAVGQSTTFIEFILSALLEAVVQAPLSEQVNEQVSEQVSKQVSKILAACALRPQSKQELLSAAGLSKAYMNYKRHILPLLESGLIEWTLPDKPNSRLQKYRLTAKGATLLQSSSGTPS